MRARPRGTNFMVVAEIRFGIEFDEGTDQFAWQVTVSPAARYQRIDDQLWAHWKSTPRENAPPGAVHQDKANTVRFVSRPITLELTPEMAFNDVKMILEFIISADAPLAAAVGWSRAWEKKATRGRGSPCVAASSLPALHSSKARG